MNGNLLILGAGQYGMVVKEIAESMKCFDRISFLDDRFGTADPNYREKAVGTFADYDAFSKEYMYAIPALGDPELRRAWIQRLEEACFRVPILVSPRAYVSPSAQLQKGCIVEPLAGVHANTVVGVGTLISMGAILNHNSFVMDFCHIDCGAVVMSGAVVGSETHVRAGAHVERLSDEVAAQTIYDSMRRGKWTG